MRLGIIGAGHIGGTLARHFVRAGHQVAISNSRGPETLQAVIEERGGLAWAMTAADAARFGEVVVISIPFGRHGDLPSSGFAGKVLSTRTTTTRGGMVTSRSSTPTGPPPASFFKDIWPAPGW